MNNAKNNLKSVVEAVKADTNAVKAELVAFGIPRSTLYHYLNNPEVDIKSTHARIIMRVTGCKLEDLIVDNTTTASGSEKFNLKA
jgi:hypothetical protein